MCVHKQNVQVLSIFLIAKIQTEPSPYLYVPDSDSVPVARQKFLHVQEAGHFLQD